jgi:hypothetical protein
LANEPASSVPPSFSFQKDYLSEGLVLQTHPTLIGVNDVTELSHKSSATK